MGWCALLLCTAAVLHYSSHPQPSEWIASLFLALNGLAQRFVKSAADFHLWFCPLLVFRDRTSAQLNWRDNQTATSNGLAFYHAKVPLIKCVGTQTRWRAVAPTCMSFNISAMASEDERLRFRHGVYIITRQQLQSYFDGQIVCILQRGSLKVSKCMKH